MTSPIPLVLVAVLSAPTVTIEADRTPGQVTLPLIYWTTLLDQLAPDRTEEPPPPVDIALIDRTLEGSFRKGLLRATLKARFRVFDAGGHVRVPIITDEASPSEVRLNGKPTSLVKSGNMYTVGVDKPGVYEVQVTFYKGHEQDRFSRRLQVALPPGGVTRMAIQVPEPDIVAHLDRGTITAHRATADGTRLEGRLDASGMVDLSWARKVTHKGDTRVDLEMRLSTLFTVREAVVSGVAVFDVDVLDGETDRLDLSLPDGLEVTAVNGDDVLQWRGNDDSLTVLLRYLVAGRTRVAVHFQYAADITDRVRLRMPLPPAGITMQGSVGVQAPPGLQVEVAEVASANALTLRDLPAELTSLTGSPLLFGFSFAAPPEISLAISRLEEVELTSTLVDEVEASTVFIEDGTEVTKMKLHIRNNTRQYLQVRLAEGEILTHALIDGQPVRPALARDDRGQALLFSLRQSERVDPEVGRTHRVSPGETLGDIALTYYSDPGKWTVILDGNRDQLSSETSVRSGQLLRIPSAGPITVEESSFVLELAYRRKRDRMGRFGMTEIRLPELDVDAMKVTWHVYLPKAVTPLRFAGNLQQFTRIRYGTFRRLLHFFDEALGGRKVWAGSKKYESILSQRRTIYKTQAERKGGSEVSPGSFPLVGERYRFKRILADRDQPRISFIYAANSTLTAVRWAAFAGAFALAFMILRPRRRLWQWLVLAAGTVGLLLLGHYVLGVHRRILWGADLALIVRLVGMRQAGFGQRLRDYLWSPWRVVEFLTLDNLVFAAALVVIAHVIVQYPLLLSMVMLVALFGLWQRWSARAGKTAQDAEIAAEVAHV